MRPTSNRDILFQRSAQRLFSLLLMAAGSVGTLSPASPREKSRGSMTGPSAVSTTRSFQLMNEHAGYSWVISKTSVAPASFHGRSIRPTVS